MRWRSETVMTFHIVPRADPMRKLVATGTTSVVSAGTKVTRPVIRTQPKRTLARPTNASTRSSMSEPARAPTAQLVRRSPYPTSVRPIGPGATT